MKLNKYIDHTLLKPEATKEQIEKIIEEAKNMILQVSALIQLG